MLKTSPCSVVSLFHYIKFTGEGGSAEGHGRCAVPALHYL